MKKMVMLFVLAAFVFGTMAIGVAAMKSVKSESPVMTARAAIHFNVGNRQMMEGQVRNAPNAGRHVMDLRPIDKRCINTYSVKKMKKLIAEQAMQ